MSLRKLITIYRFVVLLLLVVGVAASLLSIEKNGGIADDNWWSGWLQNFSTEVFGAVLTFILIDLFLRRYESGQAREVNSRALVSRLRLAQTTLEKVYTLSEMAARDLLRGAMLERVDLQGISLEMPNFERTKLDFANLEQTKLTGANFQGASLLGTRLVKADLSESDFRDAHLTSADFSGANLSGADLRFALVGSRPGMPGANFEGAILLNANLAGVYGLHMAVRFDENTVLPDGSKWKPGTNLSKFSLEETLM